MKSFKSFLNEANHTPPVIALNVADESGIVGGLHRQRQRTGQYMPRATPAEMAHKALHIDPRISNASRGTNFKKDISTLEEHGVTKPEGLSAINYSDETEGRFGENDEKKINKHLETLKSKNAGLIAKMSPLRLTITQNGSVHSNDENTDHVLEALKRHYQETGNHSGAQHPFIIHNIADPHIPGLIGEMPQTHSPIVQNPSDKPYKGSKPKVSGKSGTDPETIAKVMELTRKL